MVSLDKAVIARMNKGGKEFEILVDPDKALEYKKGREMSVDNILVVAEIFKDARKGDRASSSDIEKAFGAPDIFKAAAEIIRHGDVQLTTEQRRKLVEEKRKQIADIIARQGIDPKTRIPHPPQRILNAMEHAHINIDPFRPAETQIKDVMEAIQPIIPIAFETLEIAVRIPVQFAGKAVFLVKKLANIKKEEWQSSYWYCVMDIPAGMQGEIYSKLNDLAAGQVEVKVLKKL